MKRKPLWSRVIGAGGNYVSEKDRVRERMSILERSANYMGVENIETSKGKWETKLPLSQFSRNAVTPDFSVTFKHL
jgi:hypothetical protein